MPKAVRGFCYYTQKKVLSNQPMFLKYSLDRIERPV